MVGRGQNDKFLPNLSYPIRMDFQYITKEFSLFLNIDLHLLGQKKWHLFPPGSPGIVEQITPW